MRNVVRFLIAGCLLLTPVAVLAERVVTHIEGVNGVLRENVQAHLGLYQARNLDNLSVWRIRALAEAAEEETALALQPFGYYRPDIRVRLEDPQDASDPWTARVRIERGEPVRISGINLEISGDGAAEPEFRQWRQEWPLSRGAILRHLPYETKMQELDAISQRLGYFNSRYLRRAIEVNPERSRAEVNIHFDTGPRSVIGEIDLPDTRFDPWLIRRLTIIEPGEPYTTSRMNEQRDVLVQSGYFERTVIEEVRRDEDAEVDLNYRLEPRLPATYRATVGFGTDTGPRMQLGYLRHYLSDRGDRLNLGFGFQERDREWVFRADYQHPYGDTPDRFLTGGLLLRAFRDDFHFHDEDKIEPVFDRFDGDRRQGELTIGRKRERTLFPERYRPLQERIFVSYLRESFDAFGEAGFSEEQTRLLTENPGLASFLKTRHEVLALGVEWSLLNMEGRDFAVSGEHYEVRLLGAAESLGSDVNFAQAYASARWHWLFADRHKLILRGEWGHTQADTTELDVHLDDRRLHMSITELPELYRFKTGGDRTVRGYGFEQLSTNRNGANHLLVGSAEYEFRVGESWSLAAFTDIGNAYNDPLEPKLKRGVGVGFRWYTLIGPVQLDFAHALDDPDSPWRLHFTIGTKLL